MVSVNNNTSTSTSSYSYLQYKNKISGLVSGMDIDSIMEKLMKAESAQMEKLQQQKQKYEWKRDTYREINTKLSAFEQKSFTDYGLKSSWNTKLVSVSNSAITASATSSANGNLSISEAKLATSGSKVITQMGVNAVVADVANNIAGITSTKGSINADTTMAQLSLSNGGTGSFEIQAVNEDGSYTTKTINYTSSDKISDVMGRINSSGVGVTAIVSGTSLSLTANNAGTADNGAINIKTDDGGLFKSLGVISGNSGSVTSSTIDGAVSVEGTKGYIVANGVQVESSSNSYSVSGYQLTLNKNINVDEDGNKLTSNLVDATKISSTIDTEQIIDKVKSFVDSYNELISSLNTSVTEKKNVDYAPLTDAQKAEMTADEITKWEAKAKAGLLKGDSTLNTTLSEMRNTLSTYNTYKMVGNQKDYKTDNTDVLYKIGIESSSTYTDNGKLVIDEDKLRAALENDPDIVSRIFTGDDATGAKGVISELRTTVKSAVNNIKNTAGNESSSSELSYSLGKSISSLTTKISDWKDRLKDIEERYWDQFSAMETAIQKANSQSSIFSS